MKDEIFTGCTKQITILELENKLKLIIVYNTAKYEIKKYFNETFLNLAIF